MKSRRLFAGAALLFAKTSPSRVWEWRRVVLTVTLILLATSSLGAGATLFAAEAEPTFRIETTPSEGLVHSPFTTQIYADHIPDTGLGSWQVNISFDVEILQIESLEFGTDLYSTGRAKFLETSDADNPGQVLMFQFTLPGDPLGPTGSDLHLATVVWQGLSGGETALALAPANLQKLKDSFSDDISPISLTENRVRVTEADRSVWLPLIVITR